MCACFIMWLCGFFECILLLKEPGVCYNPKKTEIEPKLETQFQLRAYFVIPILDAAKEYNGKTHTYSKAS